MRYWPKNRLSQFLLLAVVVMPAISDAKTLAHHGATFWGAAEALSFTFAALQTIAQIFSYFWELTPTDLYQHNLFKQLHIPYGNILTIEPKSYWWGDADFIDIRYGRPSNGKPGRLLINPAERDAFLATLRTRAVGAEFIPAPMRPSANFLLRFKTLGFSCGVRFAAILPRKTS